MASVRLGGGQQCGTDRVGLVAAQVHGLFVQGNG